MLFFCENAYLYVIMVRSYVVADVKEVRGEA